MTSEIILEDRIDFPIDYLIKNYVCGKYIKDNLPEEIRQNAEFFEDEFLKYSEDHFEGNQFKKVLERRDKGGTIRYKSGIIRIPHKPTLPIFTATADPKKEEPIGQIYIPKIVIARFKDLTQKELELDGYKTLEEAITDMKTYYKDITKESIITFYEHTQIMPLTKKYW